MEHFRLNFGTTEVEFRTLSVVAKFRKQPQISTPLIKFNEIRDMAKEKCHKNNVLERDYYHVLSTSSLEDYF